MSNKKTISLVLITVIMAISYSTALCQISENEAYKLTENGISYSSRLSNYDKIAAGEIPNSTTTIAPWLILLLSEDDNAPQPPQITNPCIVPVLYILIF